MTTAVTRNDRFNAVNALKYGFYAPKATAAKCGNFK
jgi:hypothetical protein